MLFNGEAPCSNKIVLVDFFCFKQDYRQFIILHPVSLTAQILNFQLIHRRLFELATNRSFSHWMIHCHFQLRIRCRNLNFGRHQCPLRVAIAEDFDRLFRDQNNLHTISSLVVS